MNQVISATYFRNLSGIFFIALFVVGCSSNSDSYNLGYEHGKSETFSQNVFYSGETPQSQCAMLINFAKEGSPNDGINWEKVVSGEYIKGCFDGYKAAHPAMKL